MRASPWPPLLTALSIWFAHFVLSWAASELWPRGPAAPPLAWAATALALAALAWHAWRLRARHAAGALPGWLYRIALGATAIAAAAVGFSLMPALVLTA